MRRLLLTPLLLLSLQAQEVEPSEFLDDSEFADDMAGFSEGVSDFVEGVSNAVEEVKKSARPYVPQALMPERKHYLDEILEGFSIQGKISALSAYNYIEDIEQNSNDLTGLSMLKFSLDLGVEYKINDDHKAYGELKAYYDDIYNARSSNYPNIPDTYQYEKEYGEYYVTGRLTDEMDYRIGRQVVTWGKSDSIRVVDVINPTDNRTPGMVDFEDVKLPVGMIKLDWYVGDWQIGLIDIYEQRFSKLPEYGSGYISMDLPDFTLPDYDQQLAFNIDGRFNGWDIGFYGTDKFNDQFYLDVEFANMSLSRAIKYDRFQMLGTAFNIALGPLLLKSEVAYRFGVQYSDVIDTSETIPEITSFGEKEVLHAMVGFDLSIPDGTIAIEVSDSRIMDYDSAMGGDPFNIKEDTVVYTARYTQSFLNELLTLNGLLFRQGKELEDGGFARVWINYKASDNLAYDLGWVEYVGGDSFFYEGMKDMDKVFINARYSF
jgi:hypothetical protein